jgi:predicted amidohydrolase YtcJ
VPAAADLLITGATVWTGTSQAPGTRPGDAVAVAGDRLLAVGPQDDVLPLAGPRTERLHLPGRLVLPGFQDAHVHPPIAGRFRLHLSLHDMAGQPTYLDAIAGYAAEHPDLAWIYGGGWAMEHFPGGTPHRSVLDAVLPDRPAMLFNRDHHAAWVNSAALRLAGVDASTPDPADGRYERDPATGEPTGTLHEGAAYSFEHRFAPQPDVREWQRALLNAQAHLHALGITGWQDAWVEPEFLDAYTALADDGSLTARVVAALWWRRSGGLEQVEQFRSQREQASRPGRLVPGTVKIMLDGVLENRTGAMLEPYLDEHGAPTAGRGLDFVDPDLLPAAVTELDRNGFQVHMHAIGDRAIRNGLDAVAAARMANGPSDNRHHLAHIQVVQPADVPRFAALGVVANCQAYWAQSEPQMDELTIPLLGPGRAAMQYPFADLQRAGAVLAMGSDWSVTTADPLQQIEVAVTRVDPEHRDTPPFLPDQRLTLDAALRAFTAGSAFVDHDDDAGVLAAGCRADVTVLDRDILAPGAGPAGDARVEYTIASGQIVYASPA